jgi:hypothetical protein
MDDEKQHQECRQGAPSQDQPGPAELSLTVSALYQTLTAAPALLTDFVLLRIICFCSGKICIEIFVGRELISLISVGWPR